MAGGPFFDTNIVIDWLRRRDQAADELARYTRHRISRIAWTEILGGEPVATREQVKSMIARFAVVEVDEEIAEAAADIRHRTRLKLLDSLVLATAQVKGAILITRNTKDFPAQMPGIRVPYTL